MGQLLKLKRAHSPLNVRILSSTSVPFILTTAVQVPNLALNSQETNCSVELTGIENKMAHSFVRLHGFFCFQTLRSATCLLYFFTYLLVVLIIKILNWLKVYKNAKL